MASVEAVPLDFNEHLFRTDTTRAQEQQTVAPSDVALSLHEYPSTDLSQSLQSHAANDPDADHMDKDLNHSFSTSTISEPSSAAIQMLDGDSADQPLAVPPDEVGSSDDSQEWTESDSQEHKRVKVYELVGSRWEDQGTAFCYGHFDESTNEAQLVARSESDLDSIVLSTTIRSKDVYQRQQETLIVWTEPDGVDYALSFQETEGCSEVWNFICEVQAHMKASEDHGFGPSPSNGPEPDPMFSTPKIISRGSLPEPRMGIITDIEKVIKTLSRTAIVKEKMCEWMQREGYISALADVHKKSEDLESLENLHALCSCMQTILLLNDHTIYEHILEDHVFLGVVGMLEYDPEFPNHKANYREFLRETTRFHQPIPFRDEAVQRKIHHTYRLLFLKDVVLARVLDDSTFNVINSCIIFNQIDIISHLQNERSFLTQVVDPFLDDSVAGVEWWRERLKEMERLKAKKEDTMDVDEPASLEDRKSAVNGTDDSAVIHPSQPPPSDETRRSIILLIQQLCVMGKNVQLPARLALFRTLTDRAILFPVQWAVSQDEKDPEGRQMIATAGEILSVLLDHDIHGVRGFVLRQTTELDGDKNETLLMLMCRITTRSRDLAVQSQIGDALKLMLEIPVIDQNDQSQTHLQLRILQRAKDDPGVEKFLDYFYKQCIETLFKPFGDIPEFKNLTSSDLVFSREKTNLYLYLCDLLCNFSLQHSFRSHFYMLSSNIAMRVASLLSVRDKHLRLAAFRFFRICLKMNNRNLSNHLMKHDVLRPILDLTLKESKRDNLLSASCQEFFDHMRRENIKDLINHCMTQYENKIRKLAETPLGGPRFTALIRRWEMNVEPLPEIKEEHEAPAEKDTNGLNDWVYVRGLNKDEERYFSEDGPDEEDEPIQLISSPTINMNNMKAVAGLLKRKRTAGTNLRSSNRSSQMTLPRTPPIGSLVDYGDDDEDDLGGLGGGEETAGLNRKRVPGSHTGPPATPRLSHRRIDSSSCQPLPMPEDAEDEEDNLLEALISKSGPSTIKLKPPSSSKPNSQFNITQFRVGEKRRRGEDEDDDGLMGRLAKTKRPSTGNGDTSAAGVKSAGEEGGGPKKIKLKFGAASLAAVSPSSSEPASSKDGAKDGDNG